MAQPGLTEEIVGYTGQFCWYIPPEIRDRIIDSLCTDRDALRACSMTCHAWHSRASYHLFRSISLDRGHKGHAFRTLLGSSPAIANCDLSQSMPWPALTGTIRTPHPQGAAESSNSALWLEKLLPLTGPSLRRVSSLKLSSLILSNATAQALAARFEDVRVLALDGCKGIAFSDLVEFVQWFPRLETLQLVAAHWLPRRQTTPRVVKDSFPRLRKLETSSKIDAAPLISWILEACVYEELRSLACVITGPNCALAMRELLHAIGPSLEHLSVSFQDTRDPTDVLQAAKLNFISCTGLRSLHIRCSDTAQAQYSMYHPSLSWVVMLLSKLDGHRLEAITFSICSRDVCALNLEGLDVILSRSRFTRIKAVEFDIEPHGEAYIVDTEMRVRNRMTALHAKDVLRFHFPRARA